MTMCGIDINDDIGSIMILYYWYVINENDIMCVVTVLLLSIVMCILFWMILFYGNENSIDNV